MSDLPNFQAVVKNRWPDGSAKFAVLAGRATLVAGRPLPVSVSRGTASGGTNLTEQDLRDTGITAAIQFAPYGTAQLAPLIGVASAFSAAARRWTAGRVREWISGPEMSSWIYYSPIGSDPHLAAWFEVRLWRGGAIEVVPWIENGYLNVSGPTNKAGTATFILGGQQRYTGTLDLPHHCRAMLATGSAFSHWLGADPQIVPRHDTAYLQATKLVPAYYGNVSSASPLWSQLVTTYAPLAQANFPNGMGAGGYHPSIGLLPEWDVAYLAGSADSRAFAAVIAHGYAAGRYPIHYRDETTNRPLRFSTYPDLVLNGTNSGVYNSGASSTGSYTPPNSGTAPPAWANSHHPSVGYMAYLLTGAWYFIEEVQFTSTLTWLKQTNDDRGRAKGFLKSTSGANTTRGAAWGIRTLAQAACITPDDDTALRTEFLTSFEENVSYYYARYVARSNNPQGMCTPYSDYSPGDGKYLHATWMEDFLTAAWGYSIDLGLAISPGARTNLAAFFAWKARSIVGRLGGPTATEYGFREAAQYTMAVAPSDNADWENGTGPWYANWGQIYQATLNQPNPPSASGGLNGVSFPEATGYWGNLQPAIAYAVDHQAPGALTAYQRMTAASNWGELLANFGADPVWGVKPRTATAPPPPAVPVGSSSSGLPAWVSNLPLWQWYSIPNTALSSVQPANIPALIYLGSGPQSKISAWCGAALKRRGSIYLIGAAGGHGDYAGNEVNALRLNTDTPRWTELKSFSQASAVINESAFYLDNRGASTHTYYYTQFIEARNRLMIFHNPGVASAQLPAAPAQWPYSGTVWTPSFDLSTNEWDPPTYVARYPGDGDWTAAICVKHPGTDDVYINRYASNWWRWTQATNTWAQVSTNNDSGGNYAGAAIDPSRNRMLILGSWAGTVPPRVRQLDGTQVGATFGGLGPAPLTVGSSTTGDIPGVIYDEANDAFLVFLNTNPISVYRVRASDWFVERPPISGVPPAARPNGILNSVQYVPELRGVVIVNSYAGNAYFMRTSA